MSTEVMPTSETNHIGGDGENSTGATLVTSSVNLTLGNDQLWSVIVKQRTTIKELELALANITKDRDMLLLVVKKQQPSLKPPSPTPTCSSPLSHEPALPPRSPFRYQQQQQQQYRTQDGSNTQTKITMVGGTRYRPFSAAVEDLVDSLSSVSKAKPVMTTSTSLPSSSSLLSPPPLPPIHAILDHDQKHPTHISRVLSQPNLTSTTTISTAPPRDFRMFFTNMNMIIIKVIDINLQQNLTSKSVVSFIISVHNKSLSSLNSHTNQDGTLWRIKKSFSDFKALDTLLRSHIRTVTNNKHTTMMKMEKLPEKSLFTTHNTSSTKVDQKKKLIEKYLTRVIRLPLTETKSIVEFLSTNICEEQRHRSLSSNSPCQKEGYLSLNQDQPGIWNSYYFMLHGSTLDYHDSKGGSLIGSILLTDGHMTVKRPPSSGTGLLHASDRSTITITKIKRPSLSSKPRNQQITLGMRSEMELNGWVQALSTLAQPKLIQPSQSAFTRIPKVSLSTSSVMSISKRASRFVKPSAPTLQQKLQNTPHQHDRTANRHGLPQRSNSDTSIYPDEKPCHSSTHLDDDNYADFFLTMGCMSDITPTASMTLDTRHQLPSRRQRTSLDDVFSTHHYRPSKRESTPIPHTTTSTLYEATQSTKKDDVELAKKAKSKLNRRTFWPKNIFSASHNDTTGVLRGFLLSRHSSDDTLSASLSSSFRLTKQPRSQPLEPKSSMTVPLFGVPLSKANLISDLPVIAYRCIDFLEQRQAVYEEGIYRLSGSAIKIKALRREFEEKGDFDLLTSEEYQNCDVHAVTGLLKLWLRELPSNILTESVLKKVLLVKDREDCVVELVQWIAMLPSVNYNLLRALCMHLLNVIRNSGVNKMTLRNMGIVFSPTLGIPISIFNLFLCEFDRIFDTSNQQRGRMDTETPAESRDRSENGNRIKKETSGSEEDNQGKVTTATVIYPARYDPLNSGNGVHQKAALYQANAHNPTLSDSRDINNANDNKVDDDDDDDDDDDM